MLFGSETQVTPVGDTQSKVKTIYARGVEVSKYYIDEEIRLVGERGDEVKDITAHFLSLISKYKAGEISTFAINANIVNPKTQRISRITLVTERKA